MSRILETSANHDLAVIEDSCETMFAHHNNQPVGSMGDIGCFSTYVAHLIVTGVGGVCTTNNSLFAAKMRSIVNHGLELKFLNPGKNFAPNPILGRRFKFETIGHSYRITEMEAALGLAQLDLGYRTSMLRQRKINAEILTEGLKQLNKKHEGGIARVPKVMPGNTHSWMMYPILLNRGIDKEPLMKHLNENLIETRDMLPILNQPVYNYLDPDDFPTSKWIVESGFYTGCHQDLDEEDMRYILQKMEDYFDDFRLLQNRQRTVPTTR
jgi:CDP-6-deoxy-D-xylo-4-hexulose-3-dehydrase